MEESALVILDMDDAIANGYVQLSEKMKQLIEEEKERDRLARDAARVLKEQQELMREKLKEETSKEEKEKKKEEFDKMIASVTDDGMEKSDEDTTEEKVED